VRLTARGIGNVQMLNSRFIKDTRKELVSVVPWSC